MNNLWEKVITHFTQSLTSKKFLTTLYTITWLCIIMTLFMYKSGTISEPVLWLIGTVFGTFVGGNVIGDHYGKGLVLKDKEPAKPTETIEPNKVEKTNG